MDLPTYTSIWRIEKRLYKLYDFRLPMPVPVGQIAVFAAITVPYVILLTVLGVPFDHTLFWLYVLPPGVLTWLATRPVLESKRLPELVLSQARYLGEPGTWCRMNPLAEKDDVVLVGKVWRRAEEPELAPAPARKPARQPAPAPAQARATGTRRPASAPARIADRAARGTPAAPAARPAAFGQPGLAGRSAARPPAAPGAPGRTQRRVRVPESTLAARQVWEQARATAALPAVPAAPAPRGWPGPATAPAPTAGAGAAGPPVPRAPGEPVPDRPAHRPPEIAHDSERAEPRRAPAPRVPARPRWPEASPEPTPGEAAPVPPETGRARGQAAPAGLSEPPEATAAPAEATAAPAEAPPAGLSPPAPVPVPRHPEAKPSWFRSLARRPGPDSPAVPPPAVPAPAAPPAVPAPAPDAPAQVEDAPGQVEDATTGGHPVPAPAAPGLAGFAPRPGRDPSDQADPASALAQPPAVPAAALEAPAGDAPGEHAPDGPSPVATPERPAAGPPGPAPRTPPVVVVRGSSPRPTVVEWAIGGPGQHRGGTSWREHVRVVPGRHGPGRPDMEQRDRARALLPIPEPRLAVVLGCTVGAGQTVTTLMIAEVLASLRSDPVATLDLNPGQASLACLTDAVPAATVRSLLAGPATSVRPGRRRGHPDLIAHDTAATGEGLSDPDYARLAQILTSRYPLTLADPCPSAVARLLAAADQLVLVAPASSEAPRAVAMTMEWLDGHGHAELCAGSIAVINGVSKRSMSSAEQAEQVVRGRSHAIVRVPWDDHLAQAAPGPGLRNGRPPGGPAAHFSQLRPPVQDAYTALGGVLVSALTNAERAVDGEQRRVSQ